MQYESSSHNYMNECLQVKTEGVRQYVEESGGLFMKAITFITSRELI